MVKEPLLLSSPLSELTAWRVGGRAERLYQPASIGDLGEYLQTLPATEPLTWLGLGSNVLVRDQGVLGTVIHTQPYLRALKLVEPGVIRAEAGVGCGQLARFAARMGLAGIEFLAGIPGSVGGALAMNAGCHGGETWTFVKGVETIDRKGEIRYRSPQDFDIAYRQVRGREEEWFVAGYFELLSGDKTQSLEKIRQLLDHRTMTQPIDWPNCGSVFRNPPGDYAARLIESAGLKGFSHEGAQVSDKHANFIINKGTATAKAIEELIEMVHARVWAFHQVNLIREVHIIGEG